MTTSDSSRRRRAGESSDPAAAGGPQRAADPSDPVACPDWWARPGALPTGASEIRHVPDAYRQAGMMRAAAVLPRRPAPRGRRSRATIAWTPTPRFAPIWTAS